MSKLNHARFSHFTSVQSGCALMTLATGLLWIGVATAGVVFEENWDSVDQGGDGVDSFTSGPLFPINDAATVDGSRCQFNDPAITGASETSCRPWNGSDWHVHGPALGAKSFSGDGALHMGTHPSPEPSFQASYTTAQLSAAVSPPITLGGGRGRPSDETVELSFWHIAALVDDRSAFLPQGTTVDRAVVQVASADPGTGAILSDWQTIEAFQNPYSNVLALEFSNCNFDPIDDGSLEDDVTSDPGVFPELGPSSTCAPRKTYSAMGAWSSTNTADTGNAQSEFGELGNLGSGVWVQSRFDLAAFAGETVRIRLLMSGIEVFGPDGSQWGLFFDVFTTPEDFRRGWIIDDFRVTGTAGTECPVCPPRGRRPDHPGAGDCGVRGRCGHLRPPGGR